MANSSPSRFESKNGILSQLAIDEFTVFHRSLQPVELAVRQPIYEPNQRIQYAYFPETGMISVVAQMADGNSIEVGTIGREGMAGGILVMDSDRVPHRYFTQVEGRAQRIDATVLKREAEQHPELKRLILRYEASLLAQSMQGIACNGLHSVEQRCCRWLLMARDRSDSNDIALTHEFLALMLGVRRASVSDVLGPLHDAALIRSTRGQITILDRDGLEKGACECYRVIADQQRLPLAG
ncbi:MAG TPA: Crp/Fnr family transcriptional regulator [Lacipirellulaceae bacterium]|jgi:CRP-like cAMP-binding protein|nr:Crp/Fnr family transcriptional regulator [Lacipirellulaceae bacterium]